MNIIKIVEPTSWFESEFDPVFEHAFKPAFESEFEHAFKPEFEAKLEHAYNLHLVDI